MMRNAKMSLLIEAAKVVARSERLSLKYVLAKYSEEMILKLARDANRARENAMNELRESW